MELPKLRAFVEVVRQGGFSKAVRFVFATQSTVSKAVKQLEHEIGVPPLDRIGHRIKLSAAGEIVYRRAIRILIERDDLVSGLNELRGLKCGILKLGLPPVESGILFAKLFAICRNVIQASRSARGVRKRATGGDFAIRRGRTCHLVLPVSQAFEWQ